MGGPGDPRARRGSGSTRTPSYTISGRYFESCNCAAICPCRMIGGAPGGRSTYGECRGVLSWLVEHGSVGDVSLAGLAAALVIRYHDDEPGSPWTIVLHVDARGDERQRRALEDVFLGRLGGPGVGVLPWVRKESTLVDVRTDTIELTPEGEGWRLRIGDAVTLRATRAVETDEPVACGIPGYEHVGVELYADELVVADEPFAWALEGNCAFASDFAYGSGT